MNTKVKIGIAAVIVTALVALIVLDQKTAPKDEASRAPAAADPVSDSTRSAEENEATHLFKKFQKTFEAESPATAPAPIKGSETPPGKEIRPQGPAAAEEYVVQPGDTYAEIARKKYGDSGLWEVIAKANPAVKANALRTGKKIAIPFRGDPRPAEAPVAVRTEAPAARLETAAAPAGPLPRVYEVVGGDTLSGISKKLYNTTRHAAALFEANRDKLDNANDLRVGMKLALPDGVGRQENVTPAVAAPGTTGGTAAVADAPAPAPAAGGKVHPVAPNESLWKIAEKYCGDKGILEMIQSIVKANPEKLKDEKTMLRVGWQLVIPE
jgi:nucleoid-associated protein YgaU